MRARAGVAFLGEAVVGEVDDGAEGVVRFVLVEGTKEELDGSRERALEVSVGVS